MGANKPFEDIEATLLAATKSALDELVWWAHATRWRRRPLDLEGSVAAAASSHELSLSAAFIRESTQSHSTR